MRAENDMPMLLSGSLARTRPCMVSIMLLQRVCDLPSTGDAGDGAGRADVLQAQPPACLRTPRQMRALLAAWLTVPRQFRVLQKQHRAHRVIGQLDIDDQEGGYSLVTLQRVVAGAQLRGLGQHHMLRYVVDLLLEGVDVHAQKLTAAARPSAGQTRIGGVCWLQ